MSNQQPDPIRPLELEEGSQYLLRSKPAACDPASWERVRFVGYTPCPAVVIVMIETGKRIPIARDELFSEKNQPLALFHGTGDGR